MVNRYRVSIHHPLGFYWHSDWKVLVDISRDYFIRREIQIPEPEPIRMTHGSCHVRVLFDLNVPQVKFIHKNPMGRGFGDGKFRRSVKVVVVNIFYKDDGFFHTSR